MRKKVVALASHKSQKTSRPPLTIFEMEYKGDHTMERAEKYLKSLGFENIIIIRIIPCDPKHPTQENILPFPVKGMSHFL